MLTFKKTFGVRGDIRYEIYNDDKPFIEKMTKKPMSISNGDTVGCEPLAKEISKEVIEYLLFCYNYECNTDDIQKIEDFFHGNLCLSDDITLDEFIDASKKLADNIDNPDFNEKNYYKSIITQFIKGK